MGIFVNTLGMESYEESSRHASLDPTMELSLQNVLESEMNWNATMQAIYLDELAYKAHTGEEKLYSVNEAAGVFESIKNFFKKLWDKIKALFERFVAMFNSFAKSDSAFVNKYSKTLRKLTFKDFRCDVYEFTHLKDNISTIVDSDKFNTSIQKSINTTSNIGYDIVEGILGNKDIKNDLGTLTDNDKDAIDLFCKALEKNKALDYFRGLTLGDATKPISSENYSNRLFKYFRSGKQEPKETKITNVSDYLKQIENTADDKSTAKDNYDTFKDAIENIIDSLDTLDDAIADKETNDVNTLQLRLVTRITNYLRSGLNIAEIWNGAQLKAIKDRNRQAKSVCVKALANGRKNEISTKYESSDIFGDDTDGSFLSRVELI